MRTLVKLATWLLVIGGLMIGYEGLRDQDLIEVIFGTNSLAEMIIDGSIGIAAVIVALSKK